MDTSHLPINEARKTQFLEDGFIRLDDVIDAADIAWYRAKYDELFDSGNESPRRKQLGGKDEKGRDALPQILSPSKTMPELRERPYFRRLDHIAKFILGPEAEFRTDHMIMKPAGYGAPTPWHQDQAYHDPSNYYTNINFWLPLEDATVESGCMQYVRRTHSGTVLPHRFLVPGDRNSAMVAMEQAYWTLNATPLPCPAGCVCLHHSYCMHYAGPNTTAAPRRAYIVVYALPPGPLDRPLVLPWQNREA